MCGIAGIIDSQNKVNHADLVCLNQSILHRGPDSDGFYEDTGVGLTMRRLSIIDVSGGDQPIYNEDKKVVIVFNGEIYNYKPIREQLLSLGHKMTTHSDTEVIVHGYEQWGIEGILSRIEGMFAFAIYDKEKEALHLARDRFGEKPLYYTTVGSQFIFASEMRALLAVNHDKPSINPSALHSYLALHYIPGKDSILQNIYRLLPGHYATIDLKSLSFQTERYWRLKEEYSLSAPSYKEAISFVKETFTEIVESRMIAEVPVGAFLSGGLDSSIMVSLMSRLNSNLLTFSIGFEDGSFDESKYSKSIAQMYGTQHNHFTFTEEEAIKHLPEVVHYMDEPSGDQALLPLYLLSKEARRQVTVALGGEGADEIFGGYDYYQKFSNLSISSKVKLLFKNNLIREELYETASGFPLISNLAERKELLKVTEGSFSEEKMRLPFIINPLRKAQYADISSWLVDDLLVKYDRMAMANSLEGRAPYLDSKLASYAFNLPSHYKISNGLGKIILRDAFSDALPENIQTRKKHGFNLPMGEWLKTKLRPILLETVALEQDDYINKAYYRQLVETHLNGTQDRARLIYSIMMYRLWFQNTLLNRSL
ncbi:MAG: asparagine synthase (glutamine-hydrolyzing) [Candidatus Jettenia sp.]|nr:asparagine synthase (glutamine-hydrolyzing) [Candidatus Jettenia sp.]